MKEFTAHVNQKDVILLKNGKIVCKLEESFDNEHDATLAVLKKYYKQLEKDYVQRTRRVNYALGERQTVTKIKRIFALTLPAREVKELIEEMEREC